MEKDSLQGAIEAVLFVYADPLPVEVLAASFSIGEEECQRAIDALQAEYEGRQAGLRLRRIDNCVQLCSNPAYAGQIEAVMAPPQKKQLSKSMLETLSIIAYKQPVTRMEIEEIRGVRCEYAVSQLLKQGLIEEAGRKEALGRPVLFATTSRFLELFDIENLDQLPPLLSEGDTEEEFEGV